MKESIPFKAKIYILFLSAAALAFAYYLYLVASWQEINWLTFAFFFLLTFLSDSFPVRLPNGLVVTVGFAITFASILLFNPFLVVIISVFGDMLSMRKGRNFLKYAFNASQLAISSGAAAFAFTYIYPEKLIFSAHYFLSLLLALLITFILNSTLVTLIVAMVQRERPASIWLTTIKWNIPSYLCTAPLGLLIALIYTNVGLWGLVLFLIPLILARHSFQSYVSMRQTFLDTILSLSVAIDAKDRYTKGHSSRVADYAIALAKELKWPADKIEFFRYIALLHDVGKIAVPEPILKKEGDLTREEYNRMKCHAAAGCDLIKEIKFFAEGIEIIKHHHERWDGAGYPDGLGGEQIPAGARLLSVADAFDAMTSDRPYRTTLSPLTALQEIRSGAGSQFDPRVVDAFVRIFSEISGNGHRHYAETLYGELAAVNETEAKL